MVRPIKFIEFFKAANFFFYNLGLRIFDFENERKSIGIRDVWIYLIIVLNTILVQSWIVVNVWLEMKAGHLVDAIMLNSYVCYGSVSVFKVVYIWSRRKELSACVRFLTDRFPKTTPQQLEYSLPKYVQQSTRLTVSYSALNILLVWTYNLFPLLQYWISDRWLGLVEVGQQLPYMSLPPWNSTDHWSYYVLYASNCAAGYTDMAGHTSADVLLFALIIQVIMHYRYIGESLEKYEIQGGHSEGATAEKSENDIKFICDIANYHEEVLNSSELLNDIFGLPLFLNFMTSTFIICFLGFEMTVGVSKAILLKLLFFLFSSMTQAFLICWFAEELIEASENVSTAVHNQEWYNAEVRYKKMLILISVRAQKTAYLQATSFLSISRSTMTEIMQTSYKYFALLRTIYSE